MGVGSTDLSFVVVLGGAAGNRGEEHDDTVVGGVAGVLVGESRVSKETFTGT